MKKTLIWIGSVIGAGAVMALGFGAITTEKTPRVIAVNGECVTTAPKDKTAITLRVTTLGQNAIESVRLATEQAKQITNILAQMNLEMQTTQFNSYEKTEWNRDEQKSVPLGIETTIAIEVSADNVEQIENVIGKFAGNKNVFAENLRMYTSPEAMKPITEKCLGVAVENARVRANAIAAGDNKKAGKLLSVSYGTNTSDIVAPTAGLMRSAKIMMANTMDAGGTIVTKDTEITISVNAVFEIK